MRFSFVLIIISIIFNKIFYINCFNYNKNIELPKYSNALTKLTINLINNYYSRESSPIIIKYAAKNLTNEIKELDLINEILYNVDKTKVVTIIEDNEFLPRKYLRYLNIFFVDSYLSFRKIFKQLSSYFYNYTGFYIIVFTNEDKIKNINNITYNILQDCWDRHVININLIIDHKEDEAEIYTYYPYQYKSCDNVKPLLLNVFHNENGYKKNDTLINYYPVKIKNMNLCKLKIGLFITKPFMIVKKLENGTIYTDGIEGIIVRVLSQQFNFTPDIIIPENVGGHGYMIGNKTATGLTRYLWDREVDIIIGGFAITANRLNYFSSAFIYYKSSLVIALPNGQPFSSIEKLTLPFDYKIWSILLFLIFLLFIFIKLINYFNINNNELIFFNVCTIFLGSSINIVTKKFIIRFILILLILFTMIIRNSYQGSLYNYLNQIANKTVKNGLMDLINDNYKILLTKSHLDYIQYLPYDIFDKYELYSENQTDNTIVNLYQENGLYNKNFIMILSRDYAAYYNKLNYNLLNNLICVSNEPLMPFSSTFYMWQYSAISVEFYDLTIKLSAYGFINVWARHFVEKRFIINNNLIIHLRIKKPMDFYQLQGAFEIILFLYILCFFIFLLEIYSRKIIFIQKLLNYLYK